MKKEDGHVVLSTTEARQGRRFGMTHILFISIALAVVVGILFLIFIR